MVRSSYYRPSSPRILAAMARITHFEVHAEDPARAIQFYERVLGWTFQSWGGPMEYWLVTTGPEGTPGINGGLMRRQGAAPTHGQAVNAYVCTAEVASIDETVAAAVATGGQLAVPKTAIPGVGWLAYVKDTEGNIVGLMQTDPSAA